jgi:hypothetical protein
MADHAVLATNAYLRASKYTLLAISWISGSKFRSMATEWRISSMILDIKHWSAFFSIVTGGRGMEVGGASLSLYLVFRTMP